MLTKKGEGGWIIVIIILILVIGAGIYISLKSGIVQQAIDPCEKTFQDCNHGCGEGILNSICKEKCSYDYRNCKGG